MIYKCRLCSYSGASSSGCVEHVQIHRSTTNFVFHCGQPNCPRTFRKLESFKSHVYRDHSKQKKGDSSRPLHHSEINLSCQVKLCRFTCNEYSNFMSHLKEHIEKGENVCCPFKHCFSEFRL